MHLIEQYALSCGVKISEPHVECSFYPLPFKDYIVLHPSSGMEAKNYDYFTDVLELILPYLQKRNIKIVQIGGPKDPVLPGTYPLNGKTSLNQTFYLIKNSLLVLGNDSFSSHVAGGFNKKVVSLYSNLFAECCKPFWGDETKQRLIQANRKGEKPSFSAQEGNKVVNNIKPEEVARGVLDLLSFDHTLSSHNTIHIGSKYHIPTLEIVPNFTSPDSFPAERIVNLRLDYLFNPEIMMQWVLKHKSHVVIDKELDPKYLLPIKKNLAKITFELNKTVDPNYLKFLKTLGCPLEFYTPADEHLNDVRVKFLDYEVEELSVPEKESLDNIAELCDNTYYSSSKTIYSNAQFYSSKSAWLLGIPARRDQKIIDSEEFWKELDYFRVFNQDI